MEYFREYLEQGPSLNSLIIETETERIIEMSKCDWLDDLLTAVFISHTKILTSIGNNPDANIDLTIPKTTKFIHHCYINSAREVWKNPYLYNESVSGSDYQKNMREVEGMIQTCIETTIRDLLPVKEILKQHLSPYDPANQPKEKPPNLKQMLLEELKQMNLTNVEEPVKPTPEDMDKNESPEEELDDQDVEIEETNKGTPEEDYESPDEEEIQEKCKDLDIVPLDTVEIPTVETYDNVDITGGNKETEDETVTNSMIDAFLDSLQSDDDVSDIEPDDEKVEEPANKVEEPVNKVEEQVNKVEEPANKVEDPVNKVEEPVNKVEEPVNKVEEPANKVEEPANKVEEPVNKVEEPIKEDVKIVGATKEPSKKSPPQEMEIKVIKNDQTLPSVDETTISEPKDDIEQEIISVKKQEDDDDDDETVINFFNDVANLMESKGERVNKTPEKFVLFDDADKEE
jgi:hypothetical protein